MFRAIRSSARSIAHTRKSSSLSKSVLDLARRQWSGRLLVSEEVEHALQTGAPVVALESAIITHGMLPVSQLTEGMPFPTNLETAKSVENIIRSHGVVPATIALRGGNVLVGLREEELAELSDPATGLDAVKVSRRDLGAALALGRTGGTTVAGTMVVARSCGIGSFVTGGIGGVHRGAESSMDVSADLIELGRTPMMVVCAGAKSILDIPRTLEVLETQGVCVATFGDRPDFPAFYTPSSGCVSPWQVKSIEDAAKLIHTGLTLPSPQATLLAVPIPAQHSARGDQVQKAVEQAVRESVEQGIDKRGKEVTPWLLKRVGELTTGTALELNIRLIENNAHIGAQVAAEVAKLDRMSSPNRVMPAIPAVTVGTSLKAAARSVPKVTTATTTDSLPAPQVVVFGSAAIDISATAPNALAERTTTPGSISLTPGGVGRNLAHAAQNLLPPGDVKLVAPIGAGSYENSDALGVLLKASMVEDGLRTDGLVATDGARTAACNLVLENAGDLIGGVADMSIAETLSGEAVAGGLTRGDAPPEVIAFDCNLTPSTIDAILAHAKKNREIITFADPTSVPKMARLLPLLRKYPRVLDHISPNGLELDHMYSYLTDHDDDGKGWEFINALNLGSDWRRGVELWAERSGATWILDRGAVTKMVACLPWVGSFWLKQGPGGLVRLGFQSDQDPKSTRPTVSHDIPVPRMPDGSWCQTLTLTYYAPPVIAPEEIVNTTGAGDTLAGALIAGIAMGKPEDECVELAIAAVGRTLRSHKAVA